MFSLCFFYARSISNILRFFLEILKSAPYWLNGRWFLKIVNRDSHSGNLYPIYIYIKLVVLASEPVGRRSRATELPCFKLLLPKKI